jgi:hypothetical protein
MVAVSFREILSSVADSLVAERGEKGVQDRKEIERLL